VAGVFDVAVVLAGLADDGAVAVLDGVDGVVVLVLSDVVDVVVVAVWLDDEGVGLVVVGGLADGAPAGAGALAGDVAVVGVVAVVAVAEPEDGGAAGVDVVLVSIGVSGSPLWLSWSSICFWTAVTAAAIASGVPPAPRAGSALSCLRSSVSSWSNC
jgi:hypothetical protein